MFKLSETLNKEVQKAIVKIIETGEEQVAVEGGFFVTTKRNQPYEVGFFDQIEKGDTTFYVCQKIL